MISLLRWNLQRLSASVVSSGVRFMSRRLPEILLAATVSVAPAVILQAQETEGVRIEADPQMEDEALFVGYFLKGVFGGYGGHESSPNGSSVGVTVPIRVDHPWTRPGRAESLKAIVYANGCELAKFVVDPIPPVPERLSHVCRKLGTVPLTGVVLGHPRPWELKVEFQYVGRWSHHFFGITDGSVLTLRVAEATPDRDGRFTIDLPGFANDGATKSYEGQATLRVTASTPGSNERYTLRATGDVSTATSDLAIEPEYPAEIQFVAEMY